MQSIFVYDDDKALIDAIKENTHIKTDEQAMALLTEILIVLIVDPYKIAPILDILHGPKFKKFSDLTRGIYTIGDPNEKLEKVDILKSQFEA